MKALVIFAVSGAALLAQTPPPAKSAPKAAPAAGAASKSGAATKSGAKTGAARPNPLMNPAALKAVAPALYRVKFTTTHGDFVVEVHRDWAPLGADRFYNLVKNRFFTDNAFFRVVPNFIVQFGLPADPAVGAVWQHANIKDDPVKQSNKRGTVVFATAGPNTRTTQLFINFKDNGASLDGQGFAPFGTVTEGMDVVDGLYAGYGERPDQGLINSQGKAYLEKNFPKLDVIKSAVVIFPEATTPATPAKKAAPAATATKSGTPAPKKAAKPAAKSAAKSEAARTRFWRGLDELEGRTTEPDRSASEPVLWQRREFMKLMGASLALAGTSACSRTPLEKIVPYRQGPAETTYGKPVF